MFMFEPQYLKYKRHLSMPVQGSGSDEVESMVGCKKRGRESSANVFPLQFDPPAKLLRYFVYHSRTRYALPY